MENNNRPVVSIIMPVFNAASSVGRALGAVYDQTYPAIELILVDDHSTDDSLSEINGFLQRMGYKHGLTVKTISHDINQGVAAARNTGLDHATGEYIYYVDADDFVEPDAVERLVDAAQQNDADIVGCNWYLTFDKNERKMNQPRFTTPYEGLRGILNGAMRWNLWLFLVKRELYNEYALRYIPGMDMGEDLMMMCKLFARSNKVAYVAEALYHYAQSNEDSLTRIYSDRHIFQVTRNVEEVESFLKNSIFGDKGIDKELAFLKLNIKLPLLISPDTERYRQWISWFPEANRFIMQNNAMALRTRLLQQAAVKRQFWLVRGYYWCVYKVIYGWIYK